MFEKSLTELSTQGRTRKPMTVVISSAVHVVLVTVLVLIPLIYTDALPGSQFMGFLVASPPPPPAPPAISVVEIAANEPIVVEQFQIDRNAMIAPTEIPTETWFIEDRAVPTVRGVVGGVGVPRGLEAGVPGGILDSFTMTGAPPPPAPLPVPPPPLPAEPQRIGGNVMQGELINQVQPEYPILARSARQQGAVILEATIGADGTIQDLRVISGLTLLRQAAVDAVSQWTYRPYILNGQAVPVRTTVTVTFSLR